MPGLPTYAARRYQIGMKRGPFAQLAGLTAWTLARIERGERTATQDEQARIEATLAAMEQLYARLRDRSASVA